ncbi:MAG: TolC family protein [Muribaculaceae bacterium]|nr:TolC family protein [Muribaculaceae bacterium]
MKKLTYLMATFFMLFPVIAGAQHECTMSPGELFRLADSRNRDIGAADARISVARQGEAVARNAMLPQVNASLTLSYLGDGTILDRDFGNPMRDRLPHFSNTLGVEVYQPVYTGGAITASIDMARKGTDLAANDRIATVNNIRMALVTNYLELAKSRNLLRVYDENISLTRRLIEEMRARHSQGIVLKNDITRYELRLSSLEYDRLAAANAIDILNNNIITMLGLDSDVRIIPDIDSGAEIAERMDAGEWLAAAAANAPALRALGLSADMTGLQLKMDRAEYFPKVGLVAGDNFLGPVTFEVPALNKNYNAWFIGINVKWNISSLFTTPKTTHRHHLELGRISVEREAVSADLSRRLNEALTLYHQSVERLDIERKNVQLAEENYTVVSNRFENQLALLTDMLDASNARLDADVRLVNARISTQFYYYQLHFIAGTLISL